MGLNRSINVHISASGVTLTGVKCTLGVHPSSPVALYLGPTSVTMSLGDLTFHDMNTNLMTFPMFSPTWFTSPYISPQTLPGLMSRRHGRGVP